MSARQQRRRNPVSGDWYEKWYVDITYAHPDGRIDPEMRSLRQKPIAAFPIKRNARATQPLHPFRRAVGLLCLDAQQHDVDRRIGGNERRIGDDVRGDPTGASGDSTTYSLKPRRAHDSTS